jgi:DNA polymerase (family 10)
MDNSQVAQVLETIAQILEIKGENPFKVRAYQNAARAIEGLGTDIRNLLKDNTL